MVKNLIIILTLLLSTAFARDRFTTEDRQKFLNEVKQEIAEHKVENKGLVDLQIIKPALYAELEELVKKEKLTRDEVLEIKQNYEKLSKDKSITPYAAEQTFYSFLEAQLSEKNSKALEKLKEGEICNTWSCGSDLKCAPDPVQEGTAKLKKAGEVCQEDLECLSNECVVEKVGSKKKVCEEVYRCFKVLKLGESCSQNPVCGTGSCLPYNLLTSGIGECELKGKSCKTNTDCCSNLCGKGGKCIDNYICKDCVNKGSVPQRGQKCCEGLYLNEKGVCVPDVPPTVIPQVYVSPVKSFIGVIAGIFFSEVKADELTDEIKTGKAKYSNFTATSEEDANPVNMNKVTGGLKFSGKSDFEKCDFNFKQDFYNSLIEKKSFDLLLALLAFDYVVTGDSDNDYWVINKSTPTSSIHGRLKKVGLANIEERKKLNTKFTEMNDKLTCLCLDVKGYDAITDATKKKYFESSCEEYKKYVDPTITLDKLTPDASSLRAKEMLVIWTENLAKVYAGLAVTMTGTNQDLAAVTNWVNSSAKWNDATQKNYDLFKFNIQNPSSSVAGLGAIVGALLAAGVIAVLGGFATSSLLSAWTAAGIITVSAASGAGGLWMIASLKGAWISMRPEITDNSVAPRSYSCGKKETCMEYTRTLLQPYNNICNVHSSANACIKSFVVSYEEGNVPRYIVDPWIPAGVVKAEIIKGQPLYATKIEQGFQAAKAAMINKNPGADGGGGKKGGGEYISESYLSEVFIDADVVGKYIPLAGANEDTYAMTDAKIKLIKEGARKFAVDQGFLEANDKENLDAFANYAYEYHFLWPKKSRPGEISYPTVGLQTYLSFMTDAVAGTFAAGAVDSAKDWYQMNQRHLADYQKTLQDLADRPINQAGTASATATASKLDKVKKDLLNVAAINTILNNKDLDMQLSTLGKAFVADISKSTGLGGVANFTNDQANFIGAVGKLRTTRKEQVKALDTYKKAMDASGNLERANKMSDASKKFSDKFSKGAFALGSNRYSTSSASGGAAGSGSNSGNDSQNSSKNGSGSKSGGSGAGFWGSGLGAGSGGSSFSLGAAHSGLGSGKGSDGGSESGGDGSDSGASDADKKKLADAVLARNQAGKDKYESNEDLTLFEKITNAYIRNYDKVLSKKKDKDVIEGNK